MWCPVPNKPADQKSSHNIYDKTCAAGETKQVVTTKTTYTFDIASWSWVPHTTQTTSAPVKIRDLTNEEKKQLNCDTPTQPEQHSWTFTKDRATCENGNQTKTITKTEKWTFDYINWKWVPTYTWTQTDWTNVSPLTDAQKTALGCVPPVTDVCPNIEGPQASVPAGMIISTEGTCVTVGGMGGGTPSTGGQVLGTSTTESGGHVLAEGATTANLPAEIPATGGNPNANPLTILVAGLLTYGAVYFLQRKRELTNK